jgi:hypothetical protein
MAMSTEGRLPFAEYHPPRRNLGRSTGVGMAARGPHLSERLPRAISTSGGWLANFTALAVARHPKGSDSVRSEGARANKWGVYGSTATHYSSAGHSTCCSSCQRRDGAAWVSISNGAKVGFSGRGDQCTSSRCERHTIFEPSRLCSRLSPTQMTPAGSSVAGLMTVKSRATAGPTQFPSM